MITKLEIKGKEYILTANRKSASLLAGAEKDENMIDEIFYALLKPEHNFSREEVSELLNDAEEEYGVGQLLDLVGVITEEVFTTADETKYKKIEFLNRKSKRK